jgi:hypothetical protein
LASCIGSKSCLGVAGIVRARPVNIFAGKAKYHDGATGEHFECAASYHWSRKSGLDTHVIILN